jgi:cytochrome b
VSAPAVRVWDPLVRLVHWTVAVLIMIDLLNEAGANPSHRYFGYAAAALVILRLVWGLLGSPYARLRTMAQRATQAMDFVRRHTRTHAEQYVAHTPLGALMAFTLWGLTLCVAVTGWMLQLDAFWGDESLRSIHVTTAYVLAACAGTHVTAAIFTSVTTRTNLVKSMLTGSKPAPER